MKINSELSADNKIINGLWGCYAGETLSNLERLCIYSFCANGHDFRLWSYYDIPNIPHDTVGGKVEVRDANEILPRSKIFVSHSSLAHFSDWWRWKLLHEIGGWYVDMDVVCLRPFDFSEETIFFGEKQNHVDANILKFPQSNSVAGAMAMACANPSKIVPWDNEKRRRRKILRRLKFWKNAHKKQRWGESGGPEGFTLAAKYFGVFQDTKPSWMQNFIGLAGVGYLYNDELHRAGVLHPLLQNAYAMHFINSWFSASGMDKNGVFSPNSPYEILKRRYLPELWDGQQQGEQ